MGKLCRDCPNCKSAKTGAVSNRYWCGLTGDGYNGKAMGVYPWKNKPHPKCPMRGRSREDGELHPTMKERRGKDEGKTCGTCANSVMLIGRKRTVFKCKSWLITCISTTDIRPESPACGSYREEEKHA